MAHHTVKQAYRDLTDLKSRAGISAAHIRRLAEAEEAAERKRILALASVPVEVGRMRALRVERELLAHPKERAEHVMLIDLERNDLGRICQPGTVEVNEMMVLESYAHVHHIVSNVRGELAPDAGPVDAMKAALAAAGVEVRMSRDGVEQDLFGAVIDQEVLAFGPGD